MFHPHPHLHPGIPRHTNGKPAVPGGGAALPLSRLGVIELRVRFLGIRTKIHTADSGCPLSLVGVDIR